MAKKSKKSNKTKSFCTTAPIGSIENIQQQFGLNTDSLKNVNSLDELRQDVPNMVIARCKHDSFFKQNDFTMQKIERGRNYVMSISMYKSLEYDSYNIVNGCPRHNLAPAKISFKSIYKPYQGQNLTNKKLLVMRTGGIGDLLFILPNLIYLKRQYPTCKIVFSTSPQYHSMVKRWIDDGYIDKVIALPFSDAEFKSAQYHLSFEGVIERTEVSKTTNAYKLFSQWMGLNLPSNLLHPKQSVSDKLITEVESILYTNLNIDKTDKLCAIQLKASSPIRTPHPEQFWLPIIRQIIGRGFKIVITDNPQLHDQIDKIIDKYFSGLKENIFNFAKYSKDISYAIALSKIVDVVVGTDSSLIHIAESVGTTNFGIYGPFPGSVRVSNYLYGDWIDCKFDCAPCFTHGHRPCIYGGNNGGCSPCYNEMDMSEFKQKFINLTE
jgi:ADP-heptose:LPS heptosyltransferase